MLERKCEAGLLEFSFEQPFRITGSHGIQNQLVLTCVLLRPSL